MQKFFCGEALVYKDRRRALKIVVILIRFSQRSHMPPAPGFRFNAATIFLTYPQCNLTREALLEQLQAIFEIKDYVIAQETHQDGSPHLHAFLKFERKINKRTADFADVLGFHPNITAPRSIKAVITYVEKVSDFVVSRLNYLKGWQLYSF